MSDADFLPYTLASFLLVILPVDFRIHHGEVTLSGLRVQQHTWQRSRNRGTDAEFQPATPVQFEAKNAIKSHSISFHSRRTFFRAGGFLRLRGRIKDRLGRTGM